MGPAGLTVAALAGALAPHRRLTARAGGSYVALAFAARLPGSMTALGVLTLAVAATGSLAVGGAVSGATALSSALGAPLLGWAADRRGQRPVLLASAATQAGALVALALLAGTVPVPALIGLACVVGLAAAPASALSRVRWARTTPDALGDAMSLEGAMDEVSFVIGPASIGLVAVVLGPSAAVGVDAALVGIGVTAFALHPSARWAGAPRPAVAAAAPATARTSRRVPAVLAPITGMAAMGLYFGASQSSLTAAARAAGHGSAGGLLYALMAVGSVLTALAMASVPARVGLPVRGGLAALGLGAGAAAMAGTSSMAALAVAVLVTGLFVGPAMVTCSSLIAVASAPARLGLGLTLAGSASGLAIAAGAASAGVLAERAGSDAGFAVAGAAAALLLAAMALASRSVGRAAA